jgi:two-component system chemotaxis response regulator CheB
LIEPAKPSEPKIRVLLVDDSTVVRGTLRRILEREPDIDVVGSAENGRVAVSTLGSHPADVVLLDIEMPEMDGITALPLLLRACPGVKVVMASTLTMRGAKVTLEALSLGAADYIAKPTTLRQGSGIDTIAEDVIRKVRALGGKGGAVLHEAPPATRGPVHPSVVVPRVLAIGSSTGGPAALSAVLRGLPPQFTLPILVTQHMPPTFTAMLAEHLGKDGRRPSQQARDGQPVLAGQIYVAPGDYHMVVEGGRGSGVLRLNQLPPENFCRPAVDPLFRSVAAAYGPATLAVVLTGMGEDGRRGGEAVVDAGGTVVAQDEATSVVWGMPGAVVRAGLAAAVLPLGEIAKHVAHLAKVA